MVILLCQTHIIKSQSWLNPWQAREAISIVNYNLQDLTNYQIKLDLPYRACMDSLFNDIRFTEKDGVSLLPHWVQYVDAGARAIVYVKVNKLTAYSSANIYWYYENVSAVNGSDPNSTLIYYDELDEDQGWTNFGIGDFSFSTYDGKSVLQKEGNCESQGAWLSIQDTIPDFKLLVRDYRPVEGDGDCPVNEYGVETVSYRGLNYLRDGFNTDQEGLMGIQTRAGETVSNLVTENIDQPAGDWYHTEVSYCHICLFNTNAQLWSDSMSLLGNVYNSNYEMYAFDRVTVRGGRPYYIDYIAVARKACIEPIIMFGATERCPDAILVNYTADYCDEGDGEITLQITGGTAPYTLTWYLEGDSISSLMNLSTEQVTIERLSAGQYRFEVTDANSCRN